MRKVALALSLCSSVFLLRADDTAQERLSDATKMFSEIMGTPDKGIPRTYLTRPIASFWFPE